MMKHDLILKLIWASYLLPALVLLPGSAAGGRAVQASPGDGVVAQGNSSRVFDVRSFGAIGDGKRLDTAALQSAIDAAAARGGVVLLPAGQYLSGSLHMRSHVELRLEAGATLLGSTFFTNYDKGRWYALLLADGQTDIKVAGEGTIDGQGLSLARDAMKCALAGAFGPETPELRQRQQRELLLSDADFGPLTRTDRVVESGRPLLIEFRDCKRVKVSGVTLENSSCWVEDYIGCDHLIIDGIRVKSTAYWNNDGMDITDCRNVNISHCDINAADDGICLKSEKGGKGCRNVDVTDCRIRSSASAFKLGTASSGGFHKIRASNLAIYDTFRSAIALESVDGGVLDDITVEHVRGTNTGGAIFLRLGNRNTNGEVGRLEHVIIRDVRVEVPAGKPDAGYEIGGPPNLAPHNVYPASIVGLRGHPIRDVLLEDIEIEYPGGGNSGTAQIPLDALDTVPEAANRYPEFSMFGELPAWGFYVRHAEDIKFRNVRCGIKQPDFRPAYVFDDVTGLQVEGDVVKSASKNPVMVLNQVQNASFNVSLPTGYQEIRANANCKKVTGLFAAGVVLKQTNNSDP